MVTFSRNLFPGRRTAGDIVGRVRETAFHRSRTRRSALEPGLLSSCPPALCCLSCSVATFYPLLFWWLPH